MSASFCDGALTMFFNKQEPCQSGEKFNTLNLLEKIWRQLSAAA
ncbi:hypothetical protein EM6_0137 [Asticcacaulis excentricus]|uniref:Uncharacterized protein n=1 Tax=Asticcacaulis excentricus TaxID=78587 RepID=A0A3G9G5S7_9CAUL|nr:hypothetical protein EM6_0137 [Asticcacaulis excentricus]